MSGVSGAFLGCFCTLSSALARIDPPSVGSGAWAALRQCRWYTFGRTCRPRQSV